MLAHLHIRDLAIVTTLELEFETGLTVVTGETGAGKSILIDALALALGDRADSGMIRHGAQRGEVTAAFTLKPTSDAARWLERQELAGDGECVLRRVIETEKGSRGFINGRPVPIQSLRELGELLVDMHGQHEHQSLLRRDAQRQVLDDYAGLGAEADRLAALYQEHSRLSDRLSALRRESTDRTARQELLRHQVDELAALKLTPEEVPQIEEEHARLAHGAQLLEGAQEVVQVVYDDEEQSAARLLARAAARLEGLAQFDPRLTETAKLLGESGILVEEAAGRLHQYLDGLDLDPRRLEWLDQRLATLHELARKHRVDAHDLPQVLARLETELADIENHDDILARLETELAATRADYLKLAATVSRGRKEGAQRLSQSVTRRMHSLGMPGGRFEVSLEPAPAEELTAYGLERPEFLVSANPGQPPKALAKVASGGELSRISLALQIETAALGRIPTLIFDEADVGVGGRVAEIVGQTLRALGQKRQVLTITHLAQVAAQGDHHVAVAKHTEGRTTRTAVTPLNGKARVQELARMIGGVEISKQTMAHAEDMLERASG